MSTCGGSRESKHSPNSSSLILDSSVYHVHSPNSSSLILDSSVYHVLYNKRFDVGNSGWACKSNCSIGLDQEGSPLENSDETVYWQGSGVDSFVEEFFWTTKV